jgi:hypothetical protein
MSRRHAALKPQLNRIRAWAHEGSTDAWIAHQLDTTAEAVRAFRQEHGIERGGPAPLAPITPDSVVEAMLAEEAAALEAGPEPEEPAAVVESAPEPKPAPKRRTRQRATVAKEDGAAEADVVDPPAAESTSSDEEPAVAPAKSSSRRRGTRGGAGRKAAAAAAAEESEAPPSATAQEPAENDDAESAGEDDPARSGRKRRRRGRGRGASRGLEARLLPGSVLLLDPSVTADATFQEHWAEAGALRVEVSTDAIVLRRVAEAAPDAPASQPD